jgi:branched-chain amino acid transport system permease protein
VEQFLTYTFLGLVLGAVYAIAASGLVLTYTTSGIFNFAHGAQAMLAAFMYWQLTVPWGLPALVAFLLVVGVFGPLMGMALHQVLMKGLRDVAEVTKVVVTVSVLLAMVSLSTWIWAPAEPRTVARSSSWGPRSRSRSGCGCCSPGPGSASRCAGWSTTPTCSG